MAAVKTLYSSAQRSEKKYLFQFVYWYFPLSTRTFQCCGVFWTNKDTNDIVYFFGLSFEINNTESL